MGDGGIGGNGVSDTQAAEFAASQEGIGLGTLGLTAGDLAGVTAQGESAAYGMGEFAQPGEVTSKGLVESKGQSLLGTPDVFPGGGGGVQKLPEPRAWEATTEKAAAKGEEAPAITRKKRRRSLLTPEEGGTMMGGYPVYRRSILGI